MSYYHLKNIKIDKKNNNISADVADSCFTPLNYHHMEEIVEGYSFEEKYAKFIYNVVVGNFHPPKLNIYSKLVMNSLLKNYYVDANDLGILETYNKYKNVIEGIFLDDKTKHIELESDRTLNPEKYYVLTPINIQEVYNDYFDYYINEKRELYCITKKGLMRCSTKDSDYGCPEYLVLNIDKFKEYNSFLQTNDNTIEI